MYADELLLMAPTMEQLDRHMTDISDIQSSPAGVECMSVASEAA